MATPTNSRMRLVTSRGSRIPRLWICCGPLVNCDPSHSSPWRSATAARPPPDSMRIRPGCASRGRTQAHDALSFNLLTLRAALARHDVVVVPGFLATRHQQLVTLGRGGSDLSAVRHRHRAGCVGVRAHQGRRRVLHRRPGHLPRRATNRSSQLCGSTRQGRGRVSARPAPGARSGERAGLPLVVRSVTGAGTTVSNGKHAGESRT